MHVDKNTNSGWGLKKLGIGDTVKLMCKML